MVMQRLVFYGKGGIGKSTVSTNISAVLAGRGQRVLHVGCDPKHDSTVALTRGTLIPTVVDHKCTGVVAPADIVYTSPVGVDCVEAGGPQAGVGCAGRGISYTLELMGRAGLLDENQYDVVVFDLLGDVVCGGFAAPLRHGVGEKVIIVTSEEVMSLYAANNVARAVVNYASNGVVCAGLLLNLRDESEDLGPVTRFAELLSTRVLGVIRRDPLIREAEYQRTTVVEHAPEAPISTQLGQLADAIGAVETSHCQLPTPLSDEDFHELARHRFEAPAEWIAQHHAASSHRPPTDPASNPIQAPPANRTRETFGREMRAAVAAVRQGLVGPQEALLRLKRSFPDLTHTLRVEDLR
jgi:nitrogenase iron protein NifH